MITLPTECIFEIFNNLQNYDGSLLYKSLFSCLLINRQWCRIIVPILWSNPALCDKSFIRTCLLSLNSEEQSSLIPFNIILPKNSKPLFEYTSHITSINNNLSDGINDWLKNESHRFLNEPMNAIKCSLISMFLRTSRKLKYLSFSGIIYNHIILAENISENTTLISLNFSHNYLNSQERKLILLALSKNSSLTSLIFNDNQLDSEDGKILEKVLSKNTLTSLSIVYGQLDSESGSESNSKGS
ncbi:f-box domain-containing protein [Gigaspora margarita]|uniref:F-box domain-containing protein n=1 Tax=Gigaspora margarita TaxID=4874 RepID=A0A8H4AL88_GIGMA|nr:f-box domain-containing protein [Gigaspora margarita]